MSDNFSKCLPIILTHEGGYVNHPNDPGGATNMGITQKTLSEWRGISVTVEDVKNIPPEEVKAIYRKNYWDKARCDEMPLPVALCVFDGAVNSGVSRSVRWLQAAVGTVEDGIIGKKTLAAISQKPTNKAVELIIDKRLEFLQRLSTWPTFGRGWSARIRKIRKQALMWCLNPQSVV